MRKYLYGLGAAGLASVGQSVMAATPVAIAPSNYVDASATAATLGGYAATAVIGIATVSIGLAFAWRIVGWVRGRAL